MSTINATDGAIKFAHENGVDLSLVLGSGANGRITKGDVEKHLQKPIADEWQDTAESPAGPSQPLDESLQKIQNARSLTVLNAIVSRLQMANNYTAEYQTAVRERAKTILKGKFG